jgi:uncharacterized membrane protein YraQ (UPF0718 family)/YHS domain-containing protein
LAIDPICGMKVDEKSALKLTWQGQDYFFCSEHCRDKFAAENKIEIPVCPSCGAGPGTPWWKNKIVLLFVLFLLIFVFGDFLGGWREQLWSYLRTVAWPITLGLLLGGVIDWLVPREYISVLLAGNKKRTIPYAVAAGFLMSACSHGILALAIQLYKKGAAPAAVVAFLLASPWANLPLTILMFGFFGWKAFLVVFAAVVIALITGYIFMAFDRGNLIEKNPHTVTVEAGYSIPRDIKQRWQTAKFDPASVWLGIKAIWAGSVSLANMVLWWIMLGMLIASAVAAFLPPHFMHEYMGPTILGLLVTLAIATVIEICSEGSAPLAFEIYRQTGAIGNSFVFLMAGVVTDYTEIGLIWTNIGWRTAVLMPVVTVPQVLFLGWLANFLKL